MKSWVIVHHRCYKSIKFLWSPDCETCLPLFELAWLAQFKDSTHVAVYEPESVLQGPKACGPQFLYIISQHIQTVSTWVDHFGPNDMAWQQNNPKGTWGSFFGPGPNYNTGQKNQTAPHLIGFFSFLVLYIAIQSWDGGKQNPCSLLDPKHSLIATAWSATAVGGLSYSRAPESSRQQYKIYIQWYIREEIEECNYFYTYEICSQTWSLHVLKHLIYLDVT